MTSFKRFLLRIALLGLVGGLVSCGTVHQTVSSPGFERANTSCSYCPLAAVKQATPTSCGAACLEAVAGYWKKPLSQAEVRNRFPSKDPSGYSLKELQAVAQKTGLEAFLLSMAPAPDKLLDAQLKNGRPVILAVELPLGRYFGEPIPVIEYWDSTVVGAQMKETRHTGGLPIFSSKGRTKDHFIVAFGFDQAKRRVLVMDPAYGLVKVDRQRLFGFWKERGYAALVCGSSK